jgi:flagellar basal body-associated protein FliL
MEITTLIIIFAVIVVILGSIIALVWWHLADVVFPGTAEKTGQRIFRFGKRAKEPPAKARVIEFDENKTRD